MSRLRYAKYQFDILFDQTVKSFGIGREDNFNESPEGFLKISVSDIIKAQGNLSTSKAIGRAFPDINFTEDEINSAFQRIKE